MAIINIGQVDTHLVQVFAQVYTVIVLDINKQYIPDSISLPYSRIHGTSEPSDLAKASHILIAVPVGFRHDYIVEIKSQHQVPSFHL